MLTPPDLIEMPILGVVYLWPSPDREVSATISIPEAVISMSLVIDEFFRARFWSKVDVRGGHACWPWKAYRDHRGYGKFGIPRWMAGDGPHILLAHRVAYALAYGEPPSDKMVCHRCDNPPCVRPDHLFLGVSADNVRDMWTKGRAFMPKQVGERHHSAKLTEAQVLDLRRRYRAGGITIQQLATEHGVSMATIGHTLTGRVWKHLPLSGVLSES